MNDALDLFRPSKNTWTGYRLTRLELRNFGGYHSGGQIEPDIFHVDNGATVFSGDVGSGKSTAIDAMRILFNANPHFNSASTASSRDRSVRSYALGQFSNDDPRAKGKSRLRGPDEPAQSMAVLAVFSACDGRCFTVARMYLAKGTNDAEWHSMTFPDEDVSLKSDLKAWGTQGAMKRLAQDLGGERHNRQEDFFSAFGRLLGFENGRHKMSFKLLETAISAERMGSINDFSKVFLLPEFDFEGSAQVMCDVARKTGDLQKKINRLGATVQSAEKVTGLIRAHEALEAEISVIDAQRNIASGAQIYAKMSGTRLVLSEKALLLKSLKDQEVEIAKAKDLDDSELEVVMGAISQNDGGRIEKMKHDLLTKVTGLEVRKTLQSDIRDYLAQIDVKASSDAEGWSFIPENIAKVKDKNISEMTARKDERDEIIKQISPLEVRLRDLAGELGDLDRNRSVIPDRMVQARNEIAQSAGLTQDDLPFIGEILRVKPGCEEWAEAVNRAIGGGAHSILVLPENYPDVIAIQASKNWGCKVTISLGRGNENVDNAHNGNALHRKIEVNPEAKLYDLALSTVIAMAPHACVTEAEYSSIKAPAATRGGALKSKGQSVKDDGRKSQSLIGWSVEARQAEVRQEMDDIQKEMTRRNGHKADIDAGLNRYAEKMRICEAVSRKYVPFGEIDTKNLELEIQSLREHIEILETGELKRHLERKEELKKQIKDRETQSKETQSMIGKTEQTLKHLGNDLKDCSAKVLEVLGAGPDVREGVRSALRRVGQKVGITSGTAVEIAVDLGKRDINHIDRDNLMQAWRQFERDTENVNNAIRRKVDESRLKMLSAATKFFETFPERASANITRNISDPDTEGQRNRASWALFCDRLRNEDILPLEEEIRKEVNERWAEAVDGLQTQISNYKRNIKDMEVEINRILRTVIYDPDNGTRAQISIQPAKSKLLQDFTDCLEKAVAEAAVGKAGENAMRVMGYIEATDKKKQSDERDFIIDLRNHFKTEVFEHEWVDDEIGDIVNVHQGAGAVSGGQGERLTLLLLGSAISYSFGQRDESRSDRSLGMIVLDEAFSKSSTDGGKIAAEVLKALDLQIIIATPFSHINVLGDSAKRIFNITKVDQQCQISEVRMADLGKVA